MNLYQLAYLVFLAMILNLIIYRFRGSSLTLVKMIQGAIYAYTACVAVALIGVLFTLGWNYLGAIRA